MDVSVNSRLRKLSNVQMSLRMLNFSTFGFIELKRIPVKATWKRLVQYDNRGDNPAHVTMKWTTGMKIRKPVGLTRFEVAIENTLYQDI